MKLALRLPLAASAGLRLPALSPRDRRALRLGALVALPLIAWTLAVAPYRRALDDTAQRLDAERRLRDGELQLLATAPALPAIWEEGQARLAGAAPRLFAGRGDGEAAAAVVGYLRQQAGQAGVQLTRMESRPAQPVAPGLAALAVEVRGRADLTGILLLLRALERGPKLLRLDSLEVGVDGGADAAPGGDWSSADDAAAPLAFRFTATGVALSDSLTRALGLPTADTPEP